MRYSEVVIFLCIFGFHKQDKYNLNCLVWAWTAVYILELMAMREGFCKLIQE